MPLSSDCSVYSAGKIPFGNYESLSIWCYEAVDNSSSKAFRVGTVWGVSFPKLPDAYISQPSQVFHTLLQGLPCPPEFLADEQDKESRCVDNAKYPVIYRTIKTTDNPNYFRICFIATAAENRGTPEENLIGVALTVKDDSDPKLFVRVDAKLLVAPAFSTVHLSGEQSSRSKEQVTRYFSGP